MRYLKRVYLVTMGVLFLINITNAKDLINFPVTTAKVTVSQESANAFTLQFFLNNQANLSNWDFGFFMLYVLADPSTSSLLEICQQNKCVKLTVDQNLKATNLASFLRPDLSAGHITLLKPISPFKLTAFNNYIITIKVNKAIPQNVMLMPQKLFFYNREKRQVTNILLVKLVNNNYNVKQVTLAINQHLLNNWQSSKVRPWSSPLVPLPVAVVNGKGIYLLPRRLNIYAPNAQSNIANMMASSLRKDLHLYPLLTRNKKQNAAIYFLPCNLHSTICHDLNFNPEGYILNITNTSINIYAYTQAGFFYAYQSLRQLWNYYGRAMPQQLIIDYPRFKYRGIMLDTVRHFYTIAQIKLLIDIMAMHKLNTLHLHLADDEAWRLALPHYPALALNGGKRIFGYKLGPANLIEGRFDITNYSHQEYANANTWYQGYYTLAEIKNLIKYANSQQITIIPEIELPGHARAMKKAMPKVFFSANDYSNYYSIQGYNDNVLPICNYLIDIAFTQAINGIIRDIANLFNQQTTIYAVKNEISLGGDELPANSLQGLNSCKKGQWQGLDTNQIAHLFFRQLANQLPGYKLSGWQQIVQNDDGKIDSKVINPIQVGHIWQWLPTTNQPISGFKLANDLIQANYPVVLDFADLTYFDMRYTPNWYEPGLYWATNYGDTYQALSSGWLSNKLIASNKVLGIEGTLWSELIPTQNHLFYMALPKMAGLAEASWSNANDLSWKDLAFRLGCGHRGFLSYLYKIHQVHYRGYPYGIKFEVPPHTICH